MELVVPIIINTKETLELEDVDSLKTFIKYQYTIHWHSEFALSGVLDFALKNLFDTGICIDKTILNWLKEQRKYRHFRFDLSNDFDTKNFISKIHSSKLEVHDKLYLINLVGEKSDYENLITATIDSLKDTDTEEKIEEIKKVLYTVL